MSSTTSSYTFPSTGPTTTNSHVNVSNFSPSGNYAAPTETLTTTVSLTGDFQTSFSPTGPTTTNSHVNVSNFSPSGNYAAPTGDPTETLTTTVSLTGDFQTSFSPTGPTCVGYSGACFLGSTCC